MNVFILKKRGMVVFTIVAVVICGMMFAPGLSGVFLSGSRNLPIYSVEREDNKISLTFNCAWGDEDIDSILTSLKKQNARATFFLVGEWAEKYPASAKAIAMAGHELGGHSYNHRDYTTMSEAEIKKDIAATADAIEKTAGVRINLIRVPSGSYNSDVISAVEASGYIPIQWSIDTIDYGDADCETIFKRATEKTASGDIVLMHTGTANTAATLPRILDSLSGNYAFSTVSELIYKDNFYVGNDGKMRIKGSNN